MKIFFKQDEKTNIQNGRQLCSDHEDVPIVMHNQKQLKANLMDHWLGEMWPPSSTDCNSLDYFMWCVFEREVNKCPHITLTSLKVMTSAVVTDLDREVIIMPARSSSLGLRLLWRPLEFLSNKCVYYMHVNYS